MSSLWGLLYGLLIILMTLPAPSHGSLSKDTADTNNFTSAFDPFRELRLRTNTKPSEPICCLSPLTTEPLPTTAEFLSFEEWKSKQRELQAEAHAANQTPSSDVVADEPTGASTVPSSTIINDPDLPVPALIEPSPVLSPHFRVPLVDRFNYASLDCSARIHTSHRTARSPAAILSSKKDRYMLSPCSADPNFVIVELCDDIRIDTVQLANFEFFSGVFRVFKVSVAQTYTSDDQVWTEAGTYRAKNIRSVQSFHPLVELRPFYRYIRIDFLSHYSSEFYCPVSLLRVYGLTQMEEWKWEVWQSGSEKIGLQQTMAELERVAESPNVTTATASLNATASITAEDDDVATSQESLLDTALAEKSQNFRNTTPATDPPGPHTSSPDTHATMPPSQQKENLLTKNGSSTHVPSQRSTAYGTSTQIPESTTPVRIALTTSSEYLSNSTSVEVLPTSTPPNTTNYGTLTNVSHSVSRTPSSSVQMVVALPSSSPIPSGESIYRTIMNRLAMLETNTTLYQKYVEEQTLQIREALRRLEEDVGRLEGISKSQQQTFSKSMHELSLRRKEMDEERGELLIKVNHLADEMTHEKRLGIAQLCLLLAVLVFMALTRGSRVSLLDETMHKINNFSRRRTWSSADWSRKRWLSRSRTPTPMDYLAKRELKEEGREVTIYSLGQQEGNPKSSVPFPTTPVRSQTPRSLARRPATPRRQDVLRESRPSARLHRSNSHSTPANVVLSAKRFARTAHLHEVPLSARRETANEARFGDEDPLAPNDGSPKSRDRVMSVQSLSGGSNLYHSRSGVYSSPPDPYLSGGGGEESEAGSWVDTEPGSDSESDPDDGVSERVVRQSVELKSNFDVGDENKVPIMSAPPFRRRSHLKEHTPPSPTSTTSTLE